MAYTKLFSSIVTSTIWSEDDQTRIVWITMLAMADRNGEVQGSIPGLARIAGVSVESCRAAIGRFLAPDPDSRTKDDEGRRVEEIDGGWCLLNHRKYRDMASEADRKEQSAIRQKRFRDRGKRNSNATVTHSNAPVTQPSPQKTHTEAEAEAEAITPQPPKGGVRGKRFVAPSIDEVDAYGKTLTPPFANALRFCSHYESNGWRVGKNPMKDWRAAVRTWQASDRPQAQPRRSSPTRGIQETFEIPEL